MFFSFVISNKCNANVLTFNTAKIRNIHIHWVINTVLLRWKYCLMFILCILDILIDVVYGRFLHYPTHSSSVY